MSRGLVAVTGASSGIGEAFARKLAAGHDLLLIARRDERLQLLAAELTNRYGNRVDVMAADLSLENDVQRVAERLGRESELLLLVNNAGFGTRGRFWEIALGPQEEMHRLHVMAPLRLMHAVLPGMVERDRGAIVNVASVAAFVRQPGGASYAATKTWMTTFTEAIHLQLQNAGSRVVVQALCPGYTYSEFHDKLGAERGKIAPQFFWLTAEEVVEASIDGVRRRKLFVVPGWQYRVLVSMLSKLPTAVRLAIEGSITKRRGVRASKGPGISAGSSNAQLTRGDE